MLRKGALVLHFKPLVYRGPYEVVIPHNSLCSTAINYRVSYCTQINNMPSVFMGQSCCSVVHTMKLGHFKKKRFVVCGDFYSVSRTSVSLNSAEHCTASFNVLLVYLYGND